MTIQSIVICDLETTGLDPNTDRIVELGAVLFSVRHSTVVSAFSTLVQGPGNGAEKINRIPSGAVMSAPVDIHAFNLLGGMVAIANSDGPAVFAAHRAEFDRSFLAASAPKLAASLPWLCTKFDVSWPMSKPGASCVEMALAHGVPVVSAHRALTDCMLIANTLTAVAREHDLGAILAQAMQPKSLFMIADTSFDEARNAKAKELGFAWNREARRWEKRMTVEQSEQAPFAVREVAA